jgi:EmrB/QacA subfamily drug resistance transporter
MRRRLSDPRLTVSVVFVAAMFMNTLDSTIVNTALPGIAADFGASATGSSAVISAYLVSLAVFIPASGWLGDRFGDKRTLMIGLVIFVGASGLCGAAASVSQLILFRVLQGVGGGVLTPVGMAMLMRAFPPSERARVAGILIVPTAVAPALGPVLGGLLVDELSWRWAFYLNLPLGLATLVFGACFVRSERHAAPGRFDLAGFVLAGAGLGAFMYALSDGAARGWTAPEIVISGLCGIALLVALVRRETRVREPMLDLRLLEDRLFATATGTLFLTMIAFLGSLYVFALLQQDGLGRSALVSGALTSTEAVGVIGLSQVVRRLYPRVGPRRLGMAGAGSLALMCLLLGLVGGATPIPLIAVLMFLVGGSVSVLNVPMQTAAFARVPRAASGHASSLFNGARQVSSALGVALLASVLSLFHAPAPGSGGPGGHHDLTAYHAAFFVAAGFAVAALVIASRIHDADAAATMAGGRDDVEEPDERAMQRGSASTPKRTSRAAAALSRARRGASSTGAAASARRDGGGR